jgi:hypothetical protein
MKAGNGSFEKKKTIVVRKANHIGQKRPSRSHRQRRPIPLGGSAVIETVRVSKIFMGRGSNINLLYWDTFERLKIGIDRLRSHRAGRRITPGNARGYRHPQSHVRRPGARALPPGDTLLKSSTMRDPTTPFWEYHASSNLWSSRTIPM